MSADEETLRRARGGAKSKFTRKVNLFHERLQQGDPPDVLESIYGEIVHQLQEVEVRGEALISHLEKCEGKQSEIVEANAYLVECDNNRCQVLRLLSDEKRKFKSSVNSASLKVEALKAPNFNGDVRLYPTFKDDFFNVIVTKYGRDPFVLRQCLGEEPLKVITGYEKDFDEMMRILDKEYGDPRKLVDIVINNLKSLDRLTERDDRGFVNMVTVVERCYLDLQKVGLEGEMNSVSIVSMVEKLLPRIQKREWILIADKITDKTNLFPELLSFLQCEKRVIGYSESSVRNNQGGRASACNVVRTDTQESRLLEIVRGMQEDQKNTNRILEDMRFQFVNSASHANKRSSRRCWVHEFEGHDINECGKFRSLNSFERLEISKRKGVCFRCLNEKHLSRNCKADVHCDRRDDEGNVCGKRHHPLLHGSFVGNISVSSGNCTSNRAMLAISTVYSAGQPITVLWDCGSDITMVTHSMARKLGARGAEVMMSIVKVGNVTESCLSKEYSVCIQDHSGKSYDLKAVGMDAISANAPVVDVSNVPHIFSDIDVGDLVRPNGQIDMLVGSDYCELLPQVIKTKGKLQLLRNSFGYCLRGAHPLISTNVKEVNHLTAVVNKAVVNLEHSLVVVERGENLKESLDKFFSLDNVGTECTPKCVRCLCKGCPVNGKHTMEEERELDLIEKGLSYDEKCKRWIAAYPWIKDPYKLPNNVKAAMARLLSTEKRLHRLGKEYSRVYHEEIEDMQKRGVAVKLTEQDLKRYDGPIHYIPHHEVLKPESSSTPLRIVFDSSTQYGGHRLNEYWAKGPNMLSSIIGVLLRFREETVGIVGDISKMYHSVGMSEFDQHVHRFLWRGMDTSREPDHFMLTSVTFGDRPSGAIAVMALRYTAEMSAENFPHVAELIKENTYMDDVIKSVHTFPEAFAVISDTETVLREGNFHIKHWTISGDGHSPSNMNVLNVNNAKVLGLQWIPSQDNFVFTVSVNFSRKRKGVRISPGMTKDQCLIEFPCTLTRRMVLRQVASIYDPLGFLLPVTLKAKLLMRSLVMKEEGTDKSKLIDWDEPLDEQNVREWHDFFMNLYDVEKLSFPRCVKPVNAVGQPMLIIFSDGSMMAYGCCAYVRWELSTGGYDVNILAAKNRIAPIRQITIPRMELCGAVLACRLRHCIETESKYQFKAIIHIVDSMIVRSQIQKESHGFKTFVASRIAEIQDKTITTDWFWVESRHNAADLVTKPHESCVIDRNSVWCKGPEFLYTPFAEWPISQNCEHELPDRRAVVLTSLAKEGLLSDIILGNFHNYQKLLKVTSRLIRCAKDRSFKGLFIKPSIEELKSAEGLWIKVAQLDLGDWKVRFKTLGPTLLDGIVMVGQRIAKWLKDNWNQERFILMPSSHAFTKLYMTHLHQIDHGGIDSTLARLQSRFWVPGARRILKSIKRNCVVCRKLERNLEDQCMGQVRTERMKPSPPFYHTAVDLFGPFVIKDAVRRRVRGKCFGVIFTCLVSRAVHLDITENYSTEAFLGSLRRFVSIRGYPQTIHSDNGTQLVAANKELREIAKSLDLDAISRFGNNDGIKWSFNKSSDAPWLNGACESLIRLVKNGISRSIGDSVLTFSELQTVVYEVANLLNSRPIGIKPGYDLELGVYLCPNDLLLGHNNMEVPHGIFSNEADHKGRMDFIQSIVSSFWKRWQRDYFPTLINCKTEMACGKEECEAWRYSDCPRFQSHQGQVEIGSGC